MRLLFGAAASAALAMTAVGCSSDAASTSETTAASVATTVVAPAPAVDAAAPTTTADVQSSGPASTMLTDATTIASSAVADAPTTSPAAPAATTPAVTVPVDGMSLLQAAMDATSNGYHYHAVVTVAGAVAVEVDGDRIGDGTRLGVVRGGVAVQYVITPDGTWVQPDGGDWEQLDTPPATSDPILALRSPSALSVDSVAGDVVHLTVSVPANTLGLTGDSLVPVAVVLTSGNLSQVVYSTTIDGQPASIDTVVGPALDPSPVVAPV